MPSTPTHRAAPDAGSLLSVTALPGARPGRVLIEVIGEVDTFTAPALELCLASQASQRGVCELIVDMSQVTFLGAAAVSVLVQAQRQCRMRGARLVLRSGGRRNVRRSLQLTGLTELASTDPLELEPTRDPRTASPSRTAVRRSPPPRPRRVCW